jgi:hypothetical protein
MEFVSYARLLKRHWKVALTAVVAPTVCWPLNLCPPWPDSSGGAACAIAALLSIIGLLVPYAFSRSRGKVASPVSVGAAVAAGVC